MKPITSVTGGLVVTAVLLVMLGFLASTVPVSMANQPTVNGRETVSAPASETVSAGLVVEITDVRNESGTVILVVFDDIDAFENYDYEGAKAYAELAAKSGTVQVRFPELGTGLYAVSAFHDENEDNEFNMDGMYPLEGYGTSGARGPYHEPTFGEASVGTGRVSVRMYYLK